MFKHAEHILAGFGSGKLLCHRLCYQHSFARKGFQFWGMGQGLLGGIQGLQGTAAGQLQTELGALSKKQAIRRAELFFFPQAAGIFDFGVFAAGDGFHLAPPYDPI